MTKHQCRWAPALVCHRVHRASVTFSGTLRRSVTVIKLHLNLPAAEGRWTLPQKSLISNTFPQIQAPMSRAMYRNGSLMPWISPLSHEVPQVRRVGVISSELQGFVECFFNAHSHTFAQQHHKHAMAVDRLPCVRLFYLIVVQVLTLVKYFPFDRNSNKPIYNYCCGNKTSSAESIRDTACCVSISCMGASRNVR